MATFGDLVVRLNLDKRGFDNGIRAATGSLPGLRSAALAATSGIAAIGGAAAIAAVAFKNWLAPSFEAIDTLGDLSKRLGVTTDSLAGLQHAAKLAGVDQDGLTVGIGKFLDTLSNASMGTESAVKAFDALGLKASALKNLSLEQQFVAIADALQNVQNPADRVRIAMDLFGKSGAQMLQLLADGSEELTAALEEARRLGIAPTNEEVARIQKANDALDRMSAAWNGIANTVAIEVAPAVERVANAITSSMPSAIALLKELNYVLSVTQSALMNLAEEFALSKADMLTPRLRAYIKLFETLSGYVRFFNGDKEPAVGAGAGKNIPGVGGAVGGIGPKMLAAPVPRGPNVGGGPWRGMFNPFGLGGGIGGGLGGQRFSTAPGAPFDRFRKGTVGPDSGAKDFGDRMRGQLRQTTAPGGIKGAADTLGRILRAGSATKDPVVKAVKDETGVLKGMAKDIKKLATSGMGGGLIVGAAGAGV